jgi:hypothetical protein
MANPFDSRAALEAARQGRTHEWVQEYLRAGIWANHGLADGLLLAPRWWLGPFQAPLEYFARKCGPEPEMEYVEPVENWNSYVETIAASIISPEDLPPLIVERRNGQWLIADGNHRHEAMLRKGFGSCWALGWLNSESELHAAEASISKGLPGDEVYVSP